VPLFWNGLGANLHVIIIHAFIVGILSDRVVLFVNDYSQVSDMNWSNSLSMKDMRTPCGKLRAARFSVFLSSSQPVRSNAR
jgi:hypothetical protein